MHKDNVNQLLTEKAEKSKMSNDTTEQVSAPVEEKLKPKPVRPSNQQDNSGNDGLPIDLIQVAYQRKFDAAVKTFQDKLQVVESQVQSTKQEYEDKIDAMTEDFEAKLAKVEQEKQNYKKFIYSTGVLNETPGGDELFTPGIPVSKHDYKSNSSSSVWFADRNSRSAYTAFCNYLESSPSAVSFGKNQDRVLTRDYRIPSNFMKENYDAVMVGLQNEMFKHGFLQGNTANAHAATSPGTIPPAFLETLSMAVRRQTHSPRFVFHNLIYTQLRLSERVGNVVLVPRISNLNDDHPIDDYIRDPALEITDVSVALEGGSVPAKINDLSSRNPVAIPDFYTATSVLDLINILNEKLRHNYESVQDKIIRGLLYGTSLRVYSNNSAVTDTPGDLTAGAKGTMSRQFLVNLYAYMSSLSIEAWENGCYAIVMNPTTFAQLKNSVNDYTRIVDRASADQVLNMFNRLNLGTSDRISGYEGIIEGFMVFQTNATAVGAVGAEGVNSDLLGVGATLVRSSLAVGFGTVLDTTVLPFSIAFDNNNNFGRINKAIWRKMGGYSPADVDPNGTYNPKLASADNANQQLRCIEVRTTDVEV